MNVIGISAALASSFSWALGTVLLKTVGDGISSLAMTLAKGAISLVLIRGSGLRGLSPWEEALVCSLSVLGIALSDTCFFEALKDLGPLSLVLVLLLGQVATVVFAVAFLGERPSPAAWIGIGLVMSGLGVVLTADLSGRGRTGGMRGIAFGLVSLLSMAASTIIAKKALSDVSAMQATFVRMASGTLGIFILGGTTGRLGAWMNPFADRGWRHGSSRCASSPGVSGFLCCAIKNLDVSTANTLIATEPVFVLPLAAILLREKITGRAIAGTFIAVAGVVLLCLEGKA
jgi:drug/metabolite transporter (DMT)-like permease